MARQTTLSKLLGLMLALSMIAAACGGGSDTETSAGDADASAAAAQESTSDETSELPVDATTAPTVTPEVEEPAQDGDPVEVPAEEEEPETVEPATEETETTSPGVEAVQVALRKIDDETSFAFTQGMVMEFEVMGTSMVMGSDEPMSTGHFSAGRAYAHMDLGGFMMSVFEGLLGDDETMMNMFEDMFADTEAEEWTDGGTGITIVDMSSFTTMMAGLDPASITPEMALMTDGPVLIDLNALTASTGLGDTELNAFLAQAGGGGQSFNPTDLVEMLTSAHSIEATGTGVVAGRDVELLSGSIAMAEYFDALGQDPDAMLGSLSLTGQDSNEIEAMFELMEDLVIDVVFMIDTDGVLRRAEIDMDMTNLMQGMAASDTTMNSSDFGSMKVSTWQEFDQYGENFPWDPPTNATDITSELAAMLNAQ